MTRKKDSFEPQDRYSIAEKKVKDIKGFYSHLAAYIIVNIILIAINISYLDKHENVYQWRIYTTAIFWGIGLAVHAFKVFGSDLIFTSGWEQRQIKKYMERERKEKWE